MSPQPCFRFFIQFDRMEKMSGWELKPRPWAPVLTTSHRQPLKTGLSFCFEQNGPTVTWALPVIQAPHWLSVYTVLLNPDSSPVQTDVSRYEHFGFIETESLKWSAVCPCQLIEEVLLQITILHHGVHHRKVPFQWPGTSILSLFSLSVGDAKDKEMP